MLGYYVWLLDAIGEQKCSCLHFTLFWGKRALEPPFKQTKPRTTQSSKRGHAVGVPVPTLHSCSSSSADIGGDYLSKITQTGDGARL
ncbi:hypothetical protein ANANG_G00229850 [Anguilla anguilla]|uniref:Uncharacterized protein n=1 Tax=Anguilla anguilla TaxID=7936 RepID=A0A9D3LXX0_ANGAN|nr:hypothetical protein ANANG_G00229850 [Anguilla anguilla]